MPKTPPKSPAKTPALTPTKTPDAAPRAAALPATPTIPLSPDVLAAYQDLYKKLNDALNSTMDLATVQALNQSLLQVDQVLTEDQEYTLSKDTAVFASLQQNIKTVNDGLTTLQSQIKSIASHFAMAGDILSAIDKVLSFF